jgi:hypothetical protein
MRQRVHSCGQVFPQETLGGRLSLTRAACCLQHFNKGWDGGAPKLQYGAGLMRLLPPCDCDPDIVAKGGCYYKGHGGDTYGFITMCALRPRVQTQHCRRRTDGAHFCVSCRHRNGFFPALNASITLAMNLRNVAALDSLQCKLMNAIYPLASYHPPQTETPIWEQIGWASLIVAALVCMVCCFGHGCKDCASFCEDCCSLNNDRDRRPPGFLHEPINR